MPAGSSTSPTYFEDLVNFITTNTHHFVLFEIIILLVLGYIIYFVNPLNVVKHYPTQLILLFQVLIFVMLCGGFYVEWKYKLHKDSKSNNKHPIWDFMFKSALMLLGILAAYYWISAIGYGIFWIFDHAPGALKLFGHASFVAALVIGLAALYVLLEPVLTETANSNKYSKFLIDLFFYIPCLVIKFVNYVKEQWKITTKPIWIILFMEFFVIIVYYLGPYIISLFTKLSSNQMLREPVYIDYATDIGPFQNITYTDATKPNGPGYSYNYSVSAWFSLNPQSLSTRPAYSKYANILSFANKPRLEYNGILNTLRVRSQISAPKPNTDTSYNIPIATNQKQIYITDDVPFQKWNYFVMNYYGNTMDIFLNGELVSSVPDVVPCMSAGRVIVGQDAGIEGGICNVAYHSKILSQEEIKMTYKLLSKMQPPVV